MNILYLAHRIPFPPDKGDKIRSCRQLAHLARKHDVWCACLYDDPNDHRHVRTLESMCREVAAFGLPKRRKLTAGAAALLARRSMTEAYFRHGRLAATLAHWSERVAFDAALFFSSSMAQYRGVVRARRCVIDVCDWDSLKWSDYASRPAGLRSRLFMLEAARTRRIEADCCSRFHACVVATEAERQDVPIRVADPSRIHVVGNGVEVGRQPMRAASRAEPVVGFVGQMDYAPNIGAVVRFCRTTWPIIRRAVPDARFRIVGRSPVSAVVRLERLPGVTVVGAVDDIRSEIEGFAVSVAPLSIARGIQNKVLEAMASARPVVVSSRAARGLDAQDGLHFLVADAPDRQGRLVIRLLRDRSLRDRVGLCARAHVARRYRWQNALEKLEAVLLPQPTNVGGGSRGVDRDRQGTRAHDPTVVPT